MEDTKPNRVKQVQALDFLRQKARLAHNEGDGVLVNHLCSLALYKILEWKSKDELYIDIVEYRWALILPVYWQLDSNLLEMVKKVTPAVSSEQSPERDLALAVIALVSLSEQPLNSYAKQTEALTTYALSWIPDKPEIEDEILTSLIVELVWYRSTMSDLWLRVTDRFIEQASAKICETLEILKARLKQQTALLFERQASNKVFIDLTNSDLNLMRDGWVAFFDFRLERLDEILQEMSNRYGSHHFLALQQTQLRQKYSLLWSANDPMTLRQSRYDYLVQLWKEAQFDALRSQRYTENLLELIDADEVAGAHRRFTCFRLGMMRELAALRSWHLGSWFMSVSNQYASNKELFIHSVDNERFIAAYQMVRLGTLSTAIESDKKAIKQACLVLDRASDIHRMDLLREIINYRPAVQIAVLNALNEISDATPEECIDEIINFCIDVLDHPFFKRRKGIAGKMGFWSLIIPFASDPTKLCKNIKPIACQISQGSLYIGRDIEEFSKQYMVHSELDEAITYGRSIMQNISMENPYRDNLWAAIYYAITERPDLEPEFIDIIEQSAKNGLQRHYAYNIRHKLPNIPRHDAELLKEVIGKVNSQIANIMERKPNTGVLPVEFNHFLKPLLWESDQIPLAHRLIKAIKSPMIQIDEQSYFYHYLSIMVKQGEIGFAKLLLEDFVAWLDTPPKGRDIFQGINSPLSRMTASGFDSTELYFVNLSRLAYAMSIKLPNEVGEKVIKWAINLLITANDVVLHKILDIIGYYGIVKQNIELKQYLGIINGILIRSLEEIKSNAYDSYACSMLLDTIWKWSILDSTETGILAGSDETIEYRDSTVKLIAKYLPLFAKSYDPFVRAKVGIILRLWRDAKILPEGLNELIHSLKNDARARVRWQVKGL